MSAALDQVRAFFGRLTTRQRVTLGAVVIGAAALLIGVATWAGQPDYALLFGGLPAADAGKLVETLGEEAVPYELRDGGTSVYVPREQVYELRMRFAAEGLVSDGQTGYELFDRSTLGMTDFMQRVSYKRAMEGELARTIATVDGVQSARVHLVLPERSAFQADQVSPSASVVLHLAGGRPDEARVQGIASLVAGAVEGLDISDVTVLDQRGELLSVPSEDPTGALTATQLEYQHTAEDRLADRGQSMLDRMVGPGRAVVRVAAAIDFSRTVTETNSIDPESQTVLSEEQNEDNGELNQSTSMVRNYDMTRSHETQERGGGTVTGLTVSVLLDQRRVPAPNAAEGDEPAALVPQPYTNAEIQNIQQLVSDAVGLNSERGDRITVSQAAFDTTQEEEADAEMAAVHTDERLRLGLRYGLMVVALGLAAWLLRAATSRVVGAPEAPPAPEPAAPAYAAPEMPMELLMPEAAPSGDGATVQTPLPTVAVAAPPVYDAIPEDVYTSRLSPEAKARLAARRQQYDETRVAVGEKPDEAAALIQSWLAEDRLSAGR